MCGVVVKGSYQKFVEFQPKFLFGICLFLGKMRMKAFEASGFSRREKLSGKRTIKKDGVITSNVVCSVVHFIHMVQI